MWNKSLYTLAILVVGFSILFPFSKLTILAWVSLGAPDEPRRGKWLHRVECLGKWSMLDAFLSSIILALASRQFFVSAKPLAGLSAFSLAIVLSLLAGEILSASSNARRETPAPKAPKQSSGGIWLALSGIALAASLCFPFLQIKDWLLADHAYSILELAAVLAKQGAWLAALLVLLFLVIAPASKYTVGTTPSIPTQRRPPKCLRLRPVDNDTPEPLKLPPAAAVEQPIITKTAGGD